jgi:signal transduction histidine kinase
LERGKILIIDDDPAIREMIDRIVNEMGFEGVGAANGKDAMDLLRQSSFLLMITDMKIPEMDGFELTRLVRAEFPDLPVICMTAHGASTTYTDMVGSGATDYLTKPFTLDEMTAKLNRVIREKNLIRDLTQKSVELERANEDLKRLDQLKSTFISSVSHELRTPLTVIKEFISLMIEGRGGPLTDDQKEYLGIAKKNILRLTNQIETLLDFSRIESGKGLRLRFEPISLMEVIEDASMTLSTQLEEKRMVLENRIDPDTPRVFVDRNRMLEVFINLIGNGIKFTPPGGKITIDSKGLTEKRDFMKVRVTDTGIGIAPVDMPRVFDRFYQGQRTQGGVVTGVGLGLAIVKEIIEGHQGSIHAESKVGSETSFVFTLPIFGVETIFGLLLHPMLEEAERESHPLAMIRVDFWEQRTKREVALNPEIWEGVMYALKKMVRTVDTVIPFHNDAVYILSFTGKKITREIGERVQVKLTQGGYLPKGMEVQFRSCSFPEEATREEFIKRCRWLLKEE